MEAEREAKLNSVRCGVCGAWHPFVGVCPYVKSQRILRHFNGKHLQVEEVETHYFDRPEIAAESIASLETVDAMVASVEAAAAAAGQPGEGIAEQDGEAEVRHGDVAPELEVVRDLVEV